MEYVMVPVPEEHVVEVMQHVARLVARASVVPWDDDGVAALFDEVDEASRSLLSLVARTAVAGKELSDEDAAQRLELNVREVRGIVRDVNDTAQRTKREPLLALREATVVLRNGRSVPRRMFAMVEPIARAIRAHERSLLERESGPPTDQDE
jgi:transcription initiation factor IIE alpha subunit